MSIGDVLIIHSDHQPRGMWNLGRIEELLVGKDDEARAAVLRVAGQGRKAKLLRCPVQKLYPLEIPSQDQKLDDTSSDPFNTTHELKDGRQEEAVELTASDERPVLNCTLSPLHVRRSRRTAASEARDRILAQTLNEHDPED